MKISINEFAALVKSRQEILQELKTTKDYSKRIELIKELIKVEDKFLTADERYNSSKQVNPKERRELIENKLFWKFEIKHIELVDFFGVYTKYNVKFKSNMLLPSKYAAKCVVSDGKNTYVLMGRKGWEDCYNLKVLYSDKYFKDWDKLFKKNPEIKEKLWEFVISKIENRKTEKLTYIQKMIKERKKEVKDLNNPEYIKKKTDILNKEIKEREEEYKGIESTFNEINI